MNNFFESKVYKDLLEKRIIFIIGEINEKNSSEIVAKLLYLDSISNEDITIYINSPGGNVSDGLMIYDTIKYLKSDVSTISIGLAASMASIILMAGTKGKRKILPHSKVMLHDISAATSGKFNDIMVAAKEFKNTHEILFNIIKESTYFTTEEIEKELKQDFWLNSNQALKYGIVDKIIEKN